MMWTRGWQAAREAVSGAGMEVRGRGGGYLGSTAVLVDLTKEGETAEKGREERERLENREQEAVLFFPNQQVSLEEPLIPGRSSAGLRPATTPGCPSDVHTDCAWTRRQAAQWARGPQGRWLSGPSSCCLGWPPAASRSNERFAEHRLLFLRRGRGRPENPIPSPAALCRSFPAGPQPSPPLPLPSIRPSGPSFSRGRGAPCDFRPSLEVCPCPRPNTYTETLSVKEREEVGSEARA